jgi:hypothetical protein
MKNNTKQVGFGIVEIILIVLVIGLVMTGGWWIYENNRTRVGDAANGNNQIAGNPPITGEQKPTVTYLEVKEWGVKLPLSEGIKDVYYAVPAGISLNADGLPSGIIIGITSLDTSCGAVTSKSSDFNNAFAEVVRVLPNETDPVSGKLYKDLLPNGLIVGNYYYGYARMTEDKTCAPRDRLNTIDASIGSAIKNAIRLDRAQN